MVHPTDRDQAQAEPSPAALDNEDPATEASNTPPDTGLPARTGATDNVFAQGAEVIDMIGEPVPAPVREAMGLFDGPLDGVCFPDVDAALLAALADEVRQRARDTARARAALDAARHQLDLSQGALLERVRKGIAYARVFANGDTELTEQLDGLGLVRAERASKKSTRKKRRSRRQESAALTTSTADGEDRSSLPLLAAGS